MLSNTFPLLAVTLLLIGLSLASAFVVSAPFLPRAGAPLYASEPSSSSNPLCDLQTFLKLTDLVETGGQAKTAIQGGKCFLNGEIEQRRAKKLFPGDQVSFADTTLDVSDEVKERGYVYKVKVKKEKPIAKIDAYGNKEFGGKYRSDEWRAERKQKKTERKTKNSSERTGLAHVMLPPSDATE
jgi:ribosome-associated protein